MSDDATRRQSLARIASYERWAKTVDRTAATAAARRGAEARFERQVDPDGQLSPAERAKRVESARKAHYTRMAYRSAESRRKARDARKAAEQYDRDAAEADDELGGDAA